MMPEDIPNGIPARLPGESAGDYLDRLKQYQSKEELVKQTQKEIARSQKRIRSEVERILIQKEVRAALRTRSRTHSARFYQMPAHPEGLLIFAPLYILLSLIWQNITRTDAGIDKRYGLTKNKDIE